MNTVALDNARRSERRLASMLLTMAAVPALFGAIRLLELARGAPVTEANARFFAMPLPVALHIPSAVAFGLLGVFQLLPGVRRRWPARHRMGGRVLLVLGIVAALTGLWMTLVYPWPEGDGWLLYLLRLVFGTAMAASLALSVDAIRRRDFAAHGRWMIRAYAIGMGAGTQVLTHLPWFLLVGQPKELPRALLMGAGWVINVVMAEWVIRAPRRAAGVARLRAAALPAGGVEA
jgi:uncharacterized membrane protein